MDADRRSLVGALRVVSIVEATSFLALLIATAIKYAADAPGGVQVLGPIHGLLFVAYVVLVIPVRAELRWQARTTLLALLGAILPFGGYVVERRLLAGRAVARP